jgi:hypothetical protein
VAIISAADPHTAADLLVCRMVAILIGRAPSSLGVALTLRRFPRHGGHHPGANIV